MSKLLFYFLIITIMIMMIFPFSAVQEYYKVINYSKRKKNFKSIQRSVFGPQKEFT
jgi:hypothetical protein